MKKCPKCGTILDDSKTKCYMCGADLAKKPQMDFLNNFNDQVGAATTKSQDNVFNGVNTINTNVSQIGGTNSNAAFPKSAKPADFYNKQMNNPQNTGYDDRTAIEKIFSNDKRFQNGQQINAKKNLRPLKKHEDISKIRKQPKTETPPPIFQNKIENNINPIQNNTPNNLNFNNNIPVQPNIVKNINTPNMNSSQKPKINWGNNLKNNNKEKIELPKKKRKISSAFIFNTTCFILFTILLVVVYFKFSSHGPGKGYDTIADLNYKINKNFILKSDDKTSRHYTYGEKCGLRISAIANIDKDSYIDKYYKGIKEKYNADNGYITQLNEIRINKNVWSEIAIEQLKEDAAGTGGYSVNSKYRFITIVYKGKFYELIYTNLEGDNTCSAMYDELIQSLEFVEDK